jgi:putative phage-type endonuclease
MEQRTPEWYAARCGKVTGSRVADALARTKSGWGAGREKYKTQLALERLTGVSLEKQFSTQAMKDGIEREPMARAEYEAIRGVMVMEVGFVQHPRFSWGGASPDGLIGGKGVAEIKCPAPNTHADYLLRIKAESDIPGDYRQQMMWQLICAEREWCDWVSFHPDFPEKLQTKIMTFSPKPAELESIEKELVVFNDEVDAMVVELRKLMG